MEEALDDALCSVLERMESGGSVSTQWLQRRYPSSWRDLRGALALDRDLAPAAVAIERIAGIRLGDWIGSGAMGVVFEGTPDDAAAAHRMPSRVAVKIVHPEFAAGPEFSERLAREVEIGRGVVHANLVRTLAAGIDTSGGRERAYLVMEYAEGQTLRALLDELGRLPETLCRRIGREIAEALAALHAAGAVHRDVKPENVIVTPDEFVKLMDYGVAFVAEESRRAGSPPAFVGTVLYAAPEQFSSTGATIDGRTDLYALGVVLHELVTGVHPFAAKDVRTSLELRMEGPPPASRDFPDVSPFFEAAVARLLDPAADRRFASAREFADTLAEGESSAWWRRTSVELGAARHGLRRVVRVARETSVAGREAEIASLRELFASARGGHGACALVVGEAGIGKSRLVDELAVRLAAEGSEFHLLYGSYSPDAVAAGGSAFVAALRAHFGDVELEDALTSRLGALAPLVPAFAAMLRGSVARDVAALSREAVPTLFVETLRALARERTTILVVDDLHFAPDDGRDLFRDLARALGGDRVLLVGTARPEAPPGRLDALAALDRVRRIDLARLASGDVERIVTDALGGGAAAAEIASEVARRCDGSPLLAFGVLQGLRDDGAVTRELTGVWRFDRARVGTGVPAGVREMIRARLSGLDAAERELLDVAACAGFEFDPSLVGEALGVGALAALRRLARLATATRLVRSYGPLFRFDHHLAQETVHADLDAARRANYHGLLAAAIERRGESASPDADRIVALCRHRLRAGDSQRAAPLVTAAFDALAARHEHGAAIALADEALNVDGALTVEGRIDVLVRKADRLNFLGRTDEMDSASQEAVRVADALGDVVRRIHALRARGNALIALSRGDEAVRCFENAMAICPPDSAVLVTVLEERLSAALVLASRFADARRAADAALASAQGVGDRGGEARACLAIASAETDVGTVAAALDWAQRSLAIATGVGLADVAGRARILVARASLRERDFANATVAIEECHSAAVASGDRRLAAQADGLSGQQWLTLGDAVRGRRHAERALRMGRELGDPRVETLAYFHLAGAADFLGESAEALRIGWLALELTKRWSNHGRAMSVLSNLGIGYSSLGAFDEAQARYAESKELARRIENWGHVEWCDDRLVLLDVRRGETDRAEAALRRLVGRGNDIGTARHVNLAGELAGLLERSGRADEARRLVEPLIEAAERAGLRGHRLFLLMLSAVLGASSPQSAENCFAELAPTVALLPRLEARFLLWRSTHDPVHLAEAYRLHQHLRRNAPVEYRDSMVVNHPHHRAVHEAWQRHGS